MSGQLFGPNPSWKSISFREPVPVEAGKRYYMHIDDDGNPRMDEVPSDRIDALMFSRDGYVTAVSVFIAPPGAVAAVYAREETP